MSALNAPPARCLFNPILHWQTVWALNHWEMSTVKVVLDGYHTGFNYLRKCVIWVNTIVCRILIHIKVALYICPNNTDIGIHPDNIYLDTLEQPCRATLIL